ncbi:MAG: ROK family protein [Candidatus Sericytochromatia bacterium]|nr:ROK family protein [Candidatus Sericytochromatia bacterium]
MPDPAPLFGAIEAGGTKFVCAVGRGPDAILAEARFATRGPAETLAEVVAFFEAARAAHGALAALGVGAFGPLELDPAAPAFGCLGPTPKPGWAGADMVAPLRAALGCPVGLQTDVAAAGLGEGRWGAAREAGGAFAYVTVGTGVGGALFVAGEPVGGLAHPELGHIWPRRHPGDDYPGCCPFHGDCLEGLASGPAIVGRRGTTLDRLAPDDPLWEALGSYMGQLVATLLLTHAPRLVVVGGGVGSHPRLLSLARDEALRWLGGYMRPATLPAELGWRLVPPALEGRAGVLGGFVLAERALGRAAP